MHREYLSRISQSLAAGGLTVDTTIPHLEPALGIVKEAERNPNNLIVITSHGRSGLARWWMGSVADKVIHMSDNPVLILRAREQAFNTEGSRPQRLIVPLDGSELAELVLPHVSRLAAGLGMSVKLLHITPPEEEYYRFAAMGPGLAPAPAPSTPTITEFVEAAAQEGSAYLDDVKSRLIAEE